MMQLEDLKQYLRIDHDEDDFLLVSLKEVAQQYIKNGVGEVDTESNLYGLAEAILVGHLYDNREVARIGNNSYNIPHSFDAIIQQLRYCKKGDDNE